MENKVIDSCPHTWIRFVCETTFGHGDSTTLIRCICNACRKETTVSQWGFPATYDNMRLAQSNLQDGNKI